MGCTRKRCLDLKILVKVGGCLFNILKTILLLLSTITFVISVAQIGQHWNYEETLTDVAQQIKQNISPD